MAKSKRASTQARRLPSGPLDVRQRGLQAFQASRFDAAILLWSPLASQDQQVKVALAEAHFRRALSTSDLTDRIAHLREARALEPDDQRYQYHLAMALHRNGDLSAAAACYRNVVEHTHWSGATLLLGLVTLEQDSRVDLTSLPGSTPAIREALAPVQSLLNGQPLSVDAATQLSTRLSQTLGLGQSEAEAVRHLWRGLVQIDAADGSATEELADNRSLHSVRLTAIRRFYHGVVLAQAGDTDAAFALWKKVFESKQITATLLENLATTFFQQITARLDAGDIPGAAAIVQQSMDIPLTNAALNELRVYVLDQSARTAAAAGSWAQATMLWEGARQIVSENTKLGSPRPLLHNLALGYEAQERWIDAAETWRAMLRTRSRRKASDESGGLSDEHWSWVSKRVIDSYKKAGRPDEAVTVFRQMIKAEPDDLDLRVQLSDALLANEQEQAARNEIQRILQRDPYYPDAVIRQSSFLSGRYQWADAEQVLRDAIAHSPDRQDMRRHLARVLLSHGQQYINFGNYAAAIKVLTEGQELEPENYQFPLNLARMSFNQRKPKEARAQLDRVLELAGDQPTPYVEVFQCWVIEGEIDEARAVLARMEATLKPMAEMYVQLGASIIDQTTPPPPMLNPFTLEPTKPAQPIPSADTPWLRFATELFDKGVALRPGDGRICGAIAGSLLQTRPDIALPYAEQAVNLLPDDPNMHILLGLLLGLNERQREGKERLQRAARLARKQGNHALAQQADAMRREIGNPYLRTLLQMQDLYDELDEADLDDFDMNDFF